MTEFFSPRDINSQIAQTQTELIQLNPEYKPLIDFVLHSFRASGNEARRINTTTPLPEKKVSPNQITGLNKLINLIMEGVSFESSRDYDRLQINKIQSLREQMVTLFKDEQAKQLFVRLVNLHHLYFKVEAMPPEKIEELVSILLRDALMSLLDDDYLL